MSILPVNITAGALGHIAHHNELHAQRNAQEQFYVESYPEAAFQDRFASALADAHVAGGIVTIGPGTFSVTTTLGTITKPTVSVDGAGSAATTINYTGIGACLKVQLNPFTIKQAGKLSGFTINGTGAGASAIGLHICDVVGLGLEDIEVRDFTGATADGIRFENIAWFVERTTAIKLGVYNCTNQLAFASQLPDNQVSFGFNRFFDLRLNPNAGQKGIVLRNNSLFYNGTLTAICNVTDAGNVVTLQDTAVWLEWDGYITAEQTIGSGGTGVVVANGASFNGFGKVRCPLLPHSNGNAPSLGPKHRIKQVEARTFSNYSDLTAGTKPDFLGFVGTTRPVPVIYSDGDVPHAGIGFEFGTNIESPYAWMLYTGGNANAFAVRRKSIIGTMADLEEVIAFKEEGNIEVLAGDPPTLTPLGGMGTAPPVPTVDPTSNNVRGTLFLGTGTAPAGGVQVLVNFDGAYGRVPVVDITPENEASALLLPCTPVRAETGFQLSFAVAPAASQSVGTYSFTYLVIG